MLYIFDIEENLVAVLENKDGGAAGLSSLKIKEKLNGEFTLEFEVPEQHPDLEFIKERYFAAVEDTDGTFQLFIITEITDTHAETLTKSVYCQHSSLELGDEIIEELLIDRKEAADAITAIFQGSRWQVKSAQNRAGDPHDLTVRWKSRREALYTYLERWNMEIKYSVDITGGKIQHRLIELYTERGVNRGKRIEYEKDTESITRTTRADFIKTALYGLGKAYNPPTTPEGEDAAEEDKLRVNFKGVEWSTAVRTITTNMVQPYQANPEKITDLKRHTQAGTLDVAITTDVPAGVGGTKSLRITQKTADSALFALSNGYKKTIIQPNSYYSGSLYAKTNRDQELMFYIEIWNKENKYTGKMYTQKNKAATPNTFYRFIINFLAPSDAYYCKLGINMENATSGSELTWACAQLETGLWTDWTLKSREGSNPFNKPAADAYIGDDEARLKYGRYNPDTDQREHIFGVYENNDIEDPRVLLAETKTELDKVKDPEITYEIQEIAIGELLGFDHEKAGMGDTIFVIDRDLELQHATRCIEREVDLLRTEDTALVFGNFIPALTTERLKEKEKLDAAIIAAAPPQVNEELLSEGATIRTSWLEGKINALQNEVIAGDGTVTITEGNGILIENYEKTQALRLLGGMLALANEVDPVSGLYNWRAFGTGEGFLADLVETGFLKFDRSQGGTLRLGGELIGYDAQLDPIYENGRLIVTDGTTETVTLDGGQGGFDKLFVGELRGNNAVTRTTADIDYIVHPLTGDDANDGITAPLKTIQAAIDKIPNVNNFIIQITVTPSSITFSESVRIDGKNGAGTITIALGWNNTMWGDIKCYACSNQITIRSLNNGQTANVTASEPNRTEIRNGSLTGWDAPVYAHRCNFMSVYDVIISGNDQCAYGIYSNISHVKAQYCEVYNVTNSCAVVAYGATLEINDCAGYGPRGLYLVGASMAGGSGRTFYGHTNGHIYAAQGGQVNTSAIAWTYNMGAATPIYSPVTVTTYTQTGAGAWYSQGGWASSYIYQGKRPTDIPIWYGALFFNKTFSELKNPDQSNRPITKVRLKIQRSSNTGENTARKPKVYTSAITSTGGNPSTGLANAYQSGIGFNWGQEKWIDLPISIGQAFQAGTAKALIFYIGSSTTDYMKLEPKGTLEITHG